MNPKTAEEIAAYAAEEDAKLARVRKTHEEYTAAQTIIRQAVRERIAAITIRPMMYAGCREALVAQLAQLLELAGWHGGTLYDLFLRRGPVAVGLTEMLDEAWSKKIGNAARELAGLQPLK